MRFHGSLGRVCAFVAVLVLQSSAIHAAERKSPLPKTKPARPADLRSSNGGAYNGPDLEGSSIPVQMDRAITLANANAAVRACLSQQALRLWEQLFRERAASVAVSDFEGFQNAKVGQCLVYLEVRHDLNKFSDSDVDAKPWLAARRIQIVDTSTCEPAGHSTVKVRSPEERDGIQPELELSFKNLPRFKFDTVLPQGAYDDLGRLKSVGSVALVNVRLDRVPRSSGEGSEILVNEQTGVPTVLEINRFEYATCLQNELQK